MSASRDRLVMALRTHPDLPVLHPGSDRIADALLPVVERIANERAAEVITALCDDLDNGPFYAKATSYFADRDVDADGLDVARIIRSVTVAAS